jgi:opacity protein-like surface antigen
MRKTSLFLPVLIAIIIVGLPNYCFAQGLSFGVKGGMNMSNISGNDVEGTDANMGMAAGAYATISLLPSIAIQPEIIYSQKGWKESGEILGYAYEGTSRINYMEIPVLAKISFGAIVKPYILAGPYFATRLSSTAEITIGGSSTSGDIDEAIKSSDMGLTFGAGVQTPVKLSLEARYSMGLSSIDDTGYDLDFKNTNISFLVGFALF